MSTFNKRKTNLSQEALWNQGFKSGSGTGFSDLSDQYGIGIQDSISACSVQCHWIQ